MGDPVTPRHFPKATHQAILISGQNAAELIGASIPGFKPRVLHALVTPQMRSRAAHFRSFWEGRGGIWKTHELQSTNPEETTAALDEIREFCGAESLAVNITGGTKLMSIAAHLWATNAGIPDFYIDTARQLLLYPGQGLAGDPMPDVLDHASLLAVNGYQIQSEERGAPHQSNITASCEIVSIIGRSPVGAQAARVLNQLASQSRELAANLPEAPFQELKNLLAVCQKYGKTRRAGTNVFFENTDALNWCKGAWLEQYVQYILARLQDKGEIKSWAVNTRVFSKGSKNELDAIFTANNKLFLIECKTGNLADKADKRSDIFYKVKYLTDNIGGSVAGGMICSVDPFNETSDRATNASVEIVCGKDLINLEEEIKKWIRK